MESDDTRSRAYRPATIIGLFAAALLLVVSGWFLYIRFGMETPGEMPSGFSKVDRLYYDMGVLQVPDVPLPSGITLRDLEGREVELADLEGKVVFLNFWATWCPACRVEMPAMERLGRRLSDDDFAVVSVSMQEPAHLVKDYFDSQELSFAALLDPDGTVSSRFGVVSIPTTYVLNREGAVVGKAIGARDWDSKESIALFQHLMGLGLGEPPPP